MDNKNTIKSWWISIWKLITHLSSIMNGIKMKRNIDRKAKYFKFEKILIKC